MKTSELLVRSVALREGDHWVAVCLPFDLVAQGDSAAEVEEKVSAQIKDYLYEALVGQDREHAPALLTRRAPAKYWILYGFAVLCSKLRSKPKAVIRVRTPLHLAPVGC